MSLIISCLLATTSPASPQASVPHSEPIEYITGQTIGIHSEILDESRVLRVRLPAGYDQSPSRYPVLYLLDGDSHFEYVGGVIRYLRIHGTIPPVIVVALTNVNRHRDYTPYPVEGVPLSGNGRKFRRYLAEEVIPFIDQQYRTQPCRILFGHSLGGAYATYLLATSPELFGAYLMASPALPEDLQDLWRQEKAFTDDQQRSHEFVFITLGDEPGYPPGIGELVARINSFPEDQITWDYKNYLTENHLTSPLFCVPNGLRALFRDWQLPREVLDGGWPGVQAHYQDLSTRLGYEIPVPEGIVNALGYVVLQRDDIDGALSLFRYNVEKYPHSFNAWDSLAEAYWQKGDTGLSVKYYRKSLEMNPDNANAERILGIIGEIGQR